MSRLIRPLSYKLALPLLLPAKGIYCAILFQPISQRTLFTTPPVAWYVIAPSFDGKPTCCSPCFYACAACFSARPAAFSTPPSVVGSAKVRRSFYPAIPFQIIFFLLLQLPLFRSSPFSHPLFGSAKIHAFVLTLQALTKRNFQKFLPEEHSASSCC